MATPILPKINSDKISGGDDTGTWLTSTGPDVLMAISDGLDLGADVREKINSVPSPWSRAIQYISVFTNSSYPSAKWLLSQYRGFLATLALTEILHLNVTVKNIKLDKINDGFCDFKFLEALSSLDPKNENSLYSPPSENDNVWHNIFTFRLKGCVIGISSPATLIVPASKIDPSLNGKVKWIIDGQFQDPLPHLSSYQRQAIADWLVILKNKVPPPNANKNITPVKLRDGFIRIIGTFYKDLTGKDIDHEDENAQYQTSDKFNLSWKLFPDQLAGLYPIAEIDLDSNVKVIPKLMQEKAKDKPLYLYDLPDDSTISSGLKKRKQDIIVIGSLTLDDFTHEISVDKANKSGARFLSSAELFLKDLFYFKEKEVFPDNWVADMLSGSGYSIFLPINPILLDYFTGDELKERVTIELDKVDTPTSLSVGIRIPLSGFKTDNPKFLNDEDKKEKKSDFGLTDVWFYKRFSFETECELLSDHLPSIALWPNVFDPRSKGTPIEESETHPVWSLYYLFVESNKQSEKVAFTLKVPSLKHKEPSMFSTENKDVTYTQLKSYPDIFVAQNAAQQDIGLLPVSKPTNQPDLQSQNEWIVGVDFGTSLTNVAINSSPFSDSKSAKHISLLPLTKVLTRQSETSKYSLLDNFIPVEFPGQENSSDDFQTPPFPTILSINGGINSTNTSQNVSYLDIIERIRIYHADSSSNLDVSNILTDLKWSMRNYVKPFLEQLALLLSAHALSKGIIKIRWKVSYPSAFSSNARIGYLHNWKTADNESGIISWLKKVTGQTHQFEEGSDEMTESIACARYFRKNHGSVFTHACTVDIGGGTTDICFHSDSKPTYQVSVRFAGRHMFHRLFNPNAKLVNQVFAKLILDDCNPFFTGDNADSVLDLWLREKGANYLNSKHPDTTGVEGVKFRSYLAFSICGLIFYIGLVNRYLNKDEFLTKQLSTSLLLGGNGSRFFKWLNPFGKFDNTDTTKLIDSIIKSASGLNKSAFEPKLSKHPKSEACLGLAEVLDNDQVSILKVDDPYLGIACSITGLTRDSDDPEKIRFDASSRLTLPGNWDTIQKIHISSDDLQPLDDYLDIFANSILELKLESFRPLNERGKNKPLKKMTEDQKKRVMDYLNHELELKTNQGSQSVEDFDKEPTFIIAFKCLMKVLSEDLLPQ
jgi:hypothetical protein